MSGKKQYSDSTKHLEVSVSLTTGRHFGSPVGEMVTSLGSDEPSALGACLAHNAQN